MKIIGLDGKEYHWTPRHTPRENASKYHLLARKILADEFPLTQVMEEVDLPGTGLFADFYIPLKKMVIEVHGEQHYTYNIHFFRDKMSFFKAQARDRRKRSWCELNNIIYLELSWKETADEWRRKIRDR